MRWLVDLLRSDRGQTVLIMPFAFLIVLSIGAVTLEAGNLHLRQRQLDDLADSIASDAAAVGFDTEQFRADGSIRINLARAEAVIDPAIGISNLPDATPAGISVTTGGEAIEITLNYTHEFILGRQVFGSSQTLTATGNATLVPSQP